MVFDVDNDIMKTTIKKHVRIMRKKKWGRGRRIGLGRGMALWAKIVVRKLLH